VNAAGAKVLKARQVLQVLVLWAPAVPELRRVPVLTRTRGTASTLSTLNTLITVTTRPRSSTLSTDCCSR
jgi:hypothetical protein